ncbi:MAG: hypothetical protein WC479_04550 [Candidatus Izemoplasmatales bacterium]|jgi:hypothetical protein
MSDKGWIGVDLDGTLAEYHSFDHTGGIGKAVPLMLDRVKVWLLEGKTVKIFTARAQYPKQIPIIKKWLKDNRLPDLEITNVKDLEMIELWDDRCVQVVPNTGIAIYGSTHYVPTHIPDNIIKHSKIER